MTMEAVRQVRVGIDAERALTLGGAARVRVRRYGEESLCCW